MSVIFHSFGPARAMLFPACVMVVALVATLIGCNPSDGVNTIYGRRTGDAEMSVAGTVVLADMFRAAGFSVSGDDKMSPKMDKFSVIVWSPDDFTPPTEAVVNRMREWLSKPNHTLVYIGRDYDAATSYWRQVQPQAPPREAAEVARRLALAESEFAVKRGAVTSAESPWFKLETAPLKRAKNLSGPWSDTLDEAQTDIVVGHYADAYLSDQSKLISRGLRDPEVLLEAGNVPLVTYVNNLSGSNSHLILVANGSFLLNLPLANIEHRKLAGRLINECGTPGSVLFLESGPGGLAWNDQTAPDRVSPYQWLTTWPLGTILMHLFCAGIVLCAWLFPIFGRPRELPEETRADFGKHVESLGSLLATTKNEAFARQQVEMYQQLVRPEGARSATGRSLTGGRNKDPRRRPE